MGLQKILHHIFSPCDLIDAVLLKRHRVSYRYFKGVITLTIGKYFENVSIDAA